jgi:MtrB/PioB family decaheme-associated outer membrane protein
LVRTFVIGALLSSVAWAVPGMQAQAGDLPVKAPAAAEPVPYWWFHGEVEAGGRFFINNPLRSGSAYRGAPSLAKFYEYRDLQAGPFGNIWLATGSSDGLYLIDFGAENIGYNDQSYYLDASKAGEHYFSAIWDQSPHLYSTSALTFYQGLGTGALTLPPGLVGVGGFGNLPFSPTNPGPGQAGIAPFLYQTDIGIKRDTGSAAYRWTPTVAWDIKADYSHLARTGTQIDGVVGFGNPGGGNSAAIQVPKPVDDTTQNYGLNGEYAGMSPWSKKFTVKLAYNGSTYTDNLSSYTIENPFTAASQLQGTPATNLYVSPFARMSLWPSNQMNAFSGTMGADLPWMSRYVGTVSYTMMRQNDAFIPMTNNPNAVAGANNLPASSLNGAINTLMSNNVVTTKITPELTNKLSYRYYNFDNQTPELLFPTWTSLDRTGVTGGGLEGAIRSLSISYTKQNAGEDLVWKPTRAWTFGAAYGFERYDWSRESADATNEHSGKVFADWKPASWFTLRSSGYYSDRRYNNYDYAANVGAIQFPGRNPNTDGWMISPAYRQLMTDNRERWKANVAVDVLVLPGITVTPNFKYQDDHYGLNAANQLGLTDSRSWNGGADVTFIVDPRTSFMFGYLREYGTQLVYNMVGTSPTGGTSNPGGANFMLTNDRIVVDTFTALVKYEAIPNKLDLALRYTASRGVEHQNLNFASGINPVCPTGMPAGSNCQFPDVSTWFQRLDATAVYTFDKPAVAQAGLTGVIKAKLHYVWEKNSVTNWQNDPLAPFGNVGEPILIYMAGNNPNYNVHLLMASLAYTW